MTATNHAGFAVYTFTHAKGWTIGEVRTTRAEADADMALMPAGGEYTVHEAVLHRGVVV